jgi:hypothetical protein
MPLIGEIDPLMISSLRNCMGGMSTLTQSSLYCAVDSSAACWALAAAIPIQKSRVDMVRHCNGSDWKSREWRLCLGESMESFRYCIASLIILIKRKWSLELFVLSP